MARKKRDYKADKPWWERLGTFAGAVFAVAAVIGRIVGFAAAHPRIHVQVLEGSWRALGGSPESRYRYAVTLLLRNSGNRPVSMAPAERKLLRICANTERRPSDRPPSVELVRHESNERLLIVVNSMRNDTLQIRIRSLPMPFLSAATIDVELLSPIYDLGGVRLTSAESLFAGVEPASTPCNN